MDYEKKYNDVIARLRNMHNEWSNLETDGWSRRDVLRDLEYYIPELAESEDEKIRKKLLGFFGDEGEWLSGTTYAEVRAYLEKQGEQKPVECMYSKDNYTDEDRKVLCDGCQEECKFKHVEWSEEDKKMIDFAIRAIGLCRQYAINNQVNGYSNLPDTPQKYKELQDWLKSFKPKTENELEIARGEGYKQGEKEKFIKKELGCIRGYREEAIRRLHELEKQGEPKPLEEKVWTINDARDGDVLNSVRVQATIIFKGFADDGKHILAYCALQKGFFLPQELPWDRDFEPASEYWKNALYDAMTAKGYEWDADNLELKKIEQKPVEWSKEIQEEFERKYNEGKAVGIEIGKNEVQNSVGWSEEDSKWAEEIRLALRFYSKDKPFVDKLTAWFNNHIQPQPKQEWSEKDESMLNNVIYTLVPLSQTTHSGYAIGSVINWLKSLKNRVLPQPKQEWSEEDEKRMLRIATFLWKNRRGDTSEIYRQEQDINWLKSLRPQKQQKDEQPEHSFIETLYRCGKKPHWNIGDTLAYYEFTSDCEGERVLGKVTNVELDEDIEDWLYTFEDGSKCDEESLLSDETYKKN